MALKILSVVGSRPGLIKIYAFCEAIQRFNRTASHPKIQHLLIHTGQAHETGAFSRYFNDLDLPKPDIFLGVSSLTSPLQKSTAIMERFANIILQERPAVVLVAGDLDSALDCALVTKRIGYFGDSRHALYPALAHVEAGFRSIDHETPREVNRIVVDLLSDYLFTSEESSNHNLLKESVPSERIHFVGSVIIDTLLRHRSQTRKSSILNDLQLVNGSRVKPFALVALPHMFGSGYTNRLPELQQVLSEIARQMPVIFPANPSTLKYVRDGEMAEYFIDYFLDGPEPWDARVRVRIIPPLGYLDFVRLMNAATVVLTDSTGVQEETRVLGVPCITLADHASRPVTLIDGANVLVGTDPRRILDAFFQLTQRRFVRPEIPKKWDGRAAERIVKTLWKDFTHRAESAKHPGIRDGNRARPWPGYGQKSPRISRKTY